jgi:hypothetical protein
MAAFRMPTSQRPGRVLTVCSALACAALSILPSNAAAGQRASTATPQDDSPIGRWLAMDVVRLATRYRTIRDGGGVTRTNQLQAQQVGSGRLRLDAGGCVGVGFTLQSGTGFPGSWNNTGIGTGDARATIYLKQLYADVVPVRGVSVEYGGLGVVHGENSEITSYDNDGYLMGGRVTVRSPQRIFFDEAAVTVAYLGDLTTTNVLRRLEHLDSRNFVQALVVKHATPALSLSASYVDSDIEGRVWRQGARIALDRTWADTVRLEYAVRANAPHDTSSAVTIEKAIDRVTLAGGYAQVGPRLAVLNADRYGVGSGVFAGATVQLPADMMAAVWTRRQIHADPSTASKLRFDAVLAWNVLRTLQRGKQTAGSTH